MDIYLDFIIKIGAVITALGIIGGIIGTIIKLMLKPLTNTLNELKEHSNENYMSLLRLTIMSSEMPIGERIVAGHKYLKNGGNGEIKKYLKSEFNIDETVEEAEHYKK